MYRFPPRHKALIGAESIEYVLAGSGPATVVLVNGSGGPIEGWHKVFEPLSAVARVFAYNRPGIGGSAKPQVAQSAAQMVDSLRQALRAAGLQPPYVLVGHSLGGLIVNLFARLHPQETAGVVFIEASTPDDVLLLHKHDTRLQRFLAALIAKLSPPNPLAETQQLERSVAELQAAPDFPAVPLTIISGGKPAMAWATAEQALALRAKHQAALANLSPQGRQVMALRSGHFPQFSEPELVVATIVEMLNSLQARDD
jgi:pimeloyl-ACP methyl ester carboxylesterase